jgi:hypothetical protein
MPLVAVGLGAPERCAASCHRQLCLLHTRTLSILACSEGGKRVWTGTCAPRPAIPMGPPMGGRMPIGPAIPRPAGGRTPPATEPRGGRMLGGAPGTPGIGTGGRPATPGGLAAWRTLGGVPACAAGARAAGGKLPGCGGAGPESAEVATAAWAGGAAPGG